MGRAHSTCAHTPRHLRGDERAEHGGGGDAALQRDAGGLAERNREVRCTHCGVCNANSWLLPSATACHDSMYLYSGRQEPSSGMPRARPCRCHGGSRGGGHAGADASRRGDSSPSRRRAAGRLSAAPGACGSWRMIGTNPPCDRAHQGRMAHGVRHRDAIEGRCERAGWCGCGHSARWPSAGSAHQDLVRKSEDVDAASAASAAASDSPKACGHLKRQVAVESCASQIWRSCESRLLSIFSWTRDDP